MAQSNTELTAKVIKIIDPYRIAINKGIADGLETGQRFLVYEVGEELFDPDTNESLGQIEIVKGKGEVVHLQERMSTLETYEIIDYGKIQRKPFGAFFGETIIENKQIQKIFNEPAVGDKAKMIAGIGLKIE